MDTDAKRRFKMLVTNCDLLRNTDLGAAGMDLLVELLTFARSFNATYIAAVGAAPDWSMMQEIAITRALRERARDAKARELLLAKAQLESMSTPDEKRAKLRARIVELEGGAE